MPGENKITAEADREIITVRVLPWPREIVFNAWEDPAILAKWWGPKGFRNTFHEFDFHPGGSWDFTMHAPDGTEFHNQSVFVSIQKPASIVFDHLGPVHRFRVTASFHEQGTATQLSFRMLFETAEECSRSKLYVVDANEQNFDRLEQQLALLTKKV